MGRYLERTFEALLSVVLLITASFFLLRLLPGGPFDLEHKLPQQIYQQLNSEWGLDQPIIQQYLYYIVDIFQGNLGISYFHSGESVGAIVFQSFSRTLSLSVIALAFIFSSSFLLSWLLVRYRDSSVTKYLNQLVVIMGSLPTLFLGPALIYFFSYYLDILPIAFLYEMKSYILPVFTLSFRPLSQLTRLLRNAWLDSLNELFIQTARAKGLTEDQVLWGHGLRYSLSPLIAWMPSLVIGILAGTVFVEILFSIQGLGFVFVEAINQRDYPLVMGATIFYGLITIIVSWLAELLRIKLDPRGVK